jgi:hypothetical protein
MRDRPFYPFRAQPAPRFVVLACAADFWESVMPVSNTSLVERIARVIAGRVVSANAEGDETSAGGLVDSAWRDYRGDALSVIRTLREPDAAMAAAGNLDTWERMIEAALAEADAEAAS